METPAAKKQRMEINGGENGFGLDVGINYSESSVSLNVRLLSVMICLCLCVKQVFVLRGREKGEGVDIKISRLIPTVSI